MKYILFLSIFCIACQQKTTAPARSIDHEILLFSKTAEFRHESIEYAAEQIIAYCNKSGLRFRWTEEAAIFNRDSLSKYDAIVFLSTTGNILDVDQQIAMEQFIQNGKGFVGIHAATDTEYDWPWYNKLVGAYFADHPDEHQEAELLKSNIQHTSTAHLPNAWNCKDEWYNFKSVNKDIQAILYLNEESYEGGTMDGDHPIAWFHYYDGGRSWYTGAGHTKERFDELDFLEHIKQGIIFAAEQ